jgi:hypothetical protein
MGEVKRGYWVRSFIFIKAEGVPLKGITVFILFIKKEGDFSSELNSRI